MSMAARYTTAAASSLPMTMARVPMGAIMSSWSVLLRLSSLIRRIVRMGTRNSVTVKSISNRARMSVELA